MSAINAVTLKPTQSALWLRPPVPPERRNAFYRGFNAVYGRMEHRYAGLIGRMASHAGLMTIVAFVIIGLAFFGLSRVPTGFLPIEDQGYLLVAVQLPDGAALERTQKVLEQVSTIAQKDPSVANVIAISGVSALDNNATLANAGVAYVVLKDWSERDDLRTLFPRLSAALAAIDARVITLPPPPIQGIGNAGGFTLQVELRDGSTDFTKLQSITNTMVGNAQSQSALQRVSTSFRATAPQLRVEVDRVKAQTLHVSVDQVFATLATYLGSTYVVQFNKFGRVFQVYAQADATFRLRPRDIENLSVRNQQGNMVPLGTVAAITPAVGAPLISLYNLYPSSSIIGLPATGFSSGEAIRLMEENAAKTLPPGTGTEWTAMSYQEKIVGNQMYFVFAMALLLVYLVLAGQYESWYAPLSIILSVPLALVGPVLVLKGLRIDNNLYTQIGLILLDRALGQERHPDRRGGARASRARQPVGHRCGDRCRPRPVPADPDDVVCLHPRRRAAGGRERSRRQRPQIDRHHGVLRHDRLDLPRRPVRAVAVRGDPALRGMARRAQASAHPARGMTGPNAADSHNLVARCTMLDRAKC